MLGKIIRVVNSPIRVFENICSGGDIPDDERIVSMPLDTLADELEQADED